MVCRRALAVKDEGGSGCLHSALTLQAELKRISPRGGKSGGSPQARPTLELAVRLRQQTILPMRWLATRLKLGNQNSTRLRRRRKGKG
jgi:hypothetical protein